MPKTCCSSATAAARSRTVLPADRPVGPKTSTSTSPSALGLDREDPVGRVGEALDAVATLGALRRLGRRAGRPPTACCPETSDSWRAGFLLDVESHGARRGSGRRLPVAGPGGEPLYECDRASARSCPAGAASRRKRLDESTPGWTRARCASSSPGARGPGPTGRGLRRRRGRAAGGAAARRFGLAEHPPRTAAWLATVATRGRRRPPQRGRPSSPRGGDARRAAARRPSRGGRRHALPALLLLPSRPRARLPGRADPARRRRPRHREIADAFYVPRGDDGAADQPSKRTLQDAAWTSPATSPSCCAGSTRLHDRSHGPGRPGAARRSGSPASLTLATEEPEARGLLALMLLDHARLPRASTPRIASSRSTGRIAACGTPARSPRAYASCSRH